VHTTTKFNVSTIAFNATQHLAPAWIRINNTGSEPRVYTVGHVLAATVYTLSGNSSIPQNNELGHFVDRTTEGASLKFSSSIVLVAPGESAVLKVTATPPPGNASKPTTSSSCRARMAPPTAQTQATPSSRPSSQWERICSSSASSRQTAALSSQCLIP
jgi:hypothetical protein